MASDTSSVIPDSLQEPLGNSEPSGFAIPQAGIGPAPNSEPVISQTVHHGSVFNALEGGLFTVEALLRWLTSQNGALLTEDNTSTKKRQAPPFIPSQRGHGPLRPELGPGPIPKGPLAYRMACIKSDPNTHYVDGGHFLMRLKQPASDYGIIYCLSGGRADTPINQHHTGVIGDVITVGSIIAPALFRLSNNPACELRLKILCDRGIAAKPRDDHIEIALAARSKRILNSHSQSPWLTEAKFIRPLVRCDDFGLIAKVSVSLSANLAQEVIARCTELSRDAPMYWQRIARPEYGKILTSFYKMSKFKHLPWESVLACDTLFPGLLPPEIRTLSPLAYRVFTRDTIIAAYVLGFPLELCVPTRAMVLRALSHLSRVGKEQYALDVTKDGPDSDPIRVPDLFTTEPEGLQIPPAGIGRIPDFEPSGKGKGRDVYQIHNTDDVLAESVYSYGSFDRVCVVNELGIHHFIRHEFKTILASKKNIWTNIELPAAALITIEARQKMAEVLSLPPAGTILELLTRVGKDELFMDPFAKRLVKENQSGPSDLSRARNARPSTAASTAAAASASTQPPRREAWIDVAPVDDTRNHAYDSLFGESAPVSQRSPGAYLRAPEFDFGGSLYPSLRQQFSLPGPAVGPRGRVGPSGSSATRPSQTPRREGIVAGPVGPIGEPGPTEATGRFDDMPALVDASPEDTRLEDTSLEDPSGPSLEDPSGPSLEDTFSFTTSPEDRLIWGLSQDLGFLTGQGDRPMGDAGLSRRNPDTRRVTASTLAQFLNSNRPSGDASGGNSRDETTLSPEARNRLRSLFLSATPLPSRTRNYVELLSLLGLTDGRESRRMTSSIPPLIPPSVPSLAPMVASSIPPSPEETDHDVELAAIGSSRVDPAGSDHTEPTNGWLDID